MEVLNSLELINSIIIIGLVLSAASLLFIDEILPSIIAMAASGSFLALEFLLLNAPDVAIAEASVGAVLTPVIYIIVLKKVKTEKEDDNKEWKK